MRIFESKRRGGLTAFIAVLAVFLFTVCMFVGVFRWNGRDRAHLSFTQKYYFLVRDCEAATAAAVAGQVHVSGGSGLQIQTGGDYAVVVSCYFREETALSVRDGMTEKGVETRVIMLAPDDFCLYGKSAAEGNRVISNAETADSCARLLYDTANGLERTEISQTAARAAVRGVRNSLKGLRTENGDGFYARWNAALKEAERKCAECADGILFAKDVRYIQSMLCFSVVNLGTYFT